MTTDALRPLVDTLKVLAHPVRLRILALLQGGELCVCEVAEVLGLAASTVSEHLTGLRRTGLVRERKVGRWVHVALSEAAATRPLVEALWPLMAAAEPDLARDRARARASRRAICDLDTCGPGTCDPSTYDPSTYDPITYDLEACPRSDPA